MRDALYKAKRLDNGEWIEGYVVLRKYEGTNTVFEAHIILDAYVQYEVLNFGRRGGLVSECGYDCFAVDPKTVCEFTGRYDKNKNKIFENDIVKGKFHGYEETDVITWNNRVSGYNFPLWDKSEFEVIGNEFDSESEGAK